MIRKPFLLTAVSLLAAGAVSADVLFDNGTNTTNTGGWCASCSGNWTLFDDFSLTGESTIGGLSFDAAFYTGTGSLDDFNITATFWDDVNGNVLYTQTIGLAEPQAGYFSNLSNSSSQNLTVDLDLDDFTLGAGTYWLSLQGLMEGSYSYYMAFSGLSGNSVQCDNNGHCYDRYNSMPFRLMGADAVPEPATLALFVLGLLAGASTYRRARTA